MARKKAKVLISFISIVMVFLFASTATTTVAAENWGNLEVRDVMKWKLVPDPVDNPDLVVYLELRVMGFSGDDMAYSYTGTAHYDSTTKIIWSGQTTDDEEAWYVFSQSYLQKMKVAAEDDPNETWTETNFSWKGTNYKTHYVKRIDDGGNIEAWIDQGTGILFEMQGTTPPQTVELESTTASLTKAGFCLGTILIAFVSVATLVSYSIVRYGKKKRT